ncbi:unnamed protein product [Orchesella dallaii]|uniref:Uncharacterized protein n=1 Tax=Orchesella dallaii TaxID=48710 RepID=A0ABP1QCL4_9HEXA
MLPQKSTLVVFFLSSLLITFLIVNAPICSAYVNPGAWGNTEHTRSHSSLRDRLTSLNGGSNLGLCNIKRQVIEVLSEGKDETVRVPILRLGNAVSMAERYYLPMGDRLKPKKSQRAILLDVGDFITKSDGSTQIVADVSVVPQVSATNVGGILRNSG